MKRRSSAVFLILELFSGFLMSVSTSSVATTETAGPDDARAFIKEHERTVRPLEHAAALAWWNANVSGRDQDFKAKEDAQNRLDAALSDHAQFEKLKAIKAAKLDDPHAGAADRCALFALSGKAGRSRAAQADHGQGQRHRKGVQRLPRQRERPRAHRQRSAQGPQRIARLRRAQGRLGREQGGRSARRGAT